MGKICVSARKNVRHTDFQPIVLIIACIGLFVVLSFFLRAQYNGLHDEWIENLRKEREVAEMNSKLKMELSVITRARYIALKANERLGLKKPKEEEILVLR
ncbi:MAG: hypothetical protein A4E65_02397 [Syntrophorhabdus sp. PtaU1.Bin153]|nr:MAG: hypothetical protein A4E65_02397 [Syntrophorhabdus sp. PtaU1.Bin153]